MSIIHLEQYSLIEIAGVEAEKYLQGQLTCDVSKLVVGTSTITGHCDPKGKLSAIFRLIRLSDEKFYMFVRTALLPTALDNLKKYAVFSKVTFTLLKANLVGTISENMDILAEYRFSFADRTLLINPQSAVECNADFSQWDLADIQQGYPILTEKTQLEFIPQALNLQCLEQAISFQKGCYIGQETVARAKYRGMNKRAMYAFKAQTELAPDIGSEIEMQLENGWRKTGTILSAVHVEGVLWLQVVLSNQLEKEQQFRLTENSAALTLLPLPYELV